MGRLYSFNKPTWLFAQAWVQGQKGPQSFDIGCNNYTMIKDKYFYITLALLLWFVD